MSGLPASIDDLGATDSAVPVREVTPPSDAVRPRLHLGRPSAGGPAPFLDLAAGTVLETIVRAARHHAVKVGSAAEIGDLTSALERAVSLLAPELRHDLLRSLEGNFGLRGVGEGVAGHVWKPTNYGELCEGCNFPVSRSEPLLAQAVADTPCTGRYDHTADRLRAQNGSMQRRQAIQGIGPGSMRPLAPEDAP